MTALYAWSLLLTTKETHIPRFRVPVEEDGSRLDRLLQRHCDGVPRSLVMRLIRRGNVRVNRRRARPEQRLRSGACRKLRGR